MTSAETTHAKLKVGLLLGRDLRVAAWVATLVQRIQATGCADIVLLVVDASPPPAPTPSWGERLRQAPGQTMALMWQRLLDRLLQRFGQAPAQLPDAFASVDLAPTLGHLPVVPVVPQRTLWSDRFAEPDLQAVRAHQVDVLVRIGFRILRGGILQAARHGVWSFHHGDNDVNRGGPPCYWESMQDWPVTGCTLQVLSEDLDNGLVLAKTWSGTVADSVADNQRSSYWKSLSLLPRQLKRLHELGPDAFFAQARAAHPTLYGHRLFRAPVGPELARLLRQRLWRRLRRGLAGRFGFDQWILLVHASDSLSLAPWRYKRITPPADRFWADPFPVQHQGRCQVFFEELPFATGVGHIAVAELADDGSLLQPRPALVTGQHLSYPFVFEHEGVFYMVPESRAAGTVSLYRCTQWPDRWEKQMDLMSAVDAVDATLHFHEGRWWLFVNMVENRGGSTCDELFVFHAPHFATSDWAPHPANPVVSDVRRARPAGRLFMHQGRLYRPSQDSSHRYGWGLNLNWVRRLDPQAYEEEPVSKAEPDWAPDVLAVHTFNRAGRWHVIDAQVRRRR